MALRNPCFKDQIGLIWGKKKEKREGEGEEKRKRKRRSSQDQEVWNLGFCMETTLSMNFVWITWNLRLDMVNLLSLNLGF